MRTACAALCLCPLLACSVPDTQQTDLPGIPDRAPFGNVIVTAQGKCFTQTVAEETVRIVTEQLEVAPAVKAADGSVISPPVFRNQAVPRREITGPGRVFETLCPAEFTQERIATLQRALKARLAYTGPINGLYDTQTREAVQAFQASQGFDSPLIARSLAQSLGLVPVGDTRTTALAK